ncbi:MAG: D-2-hydroxyacid dehydrogenase [Anaerolineae bacterium]
MAQRNVILLGLADDALDQATRERIVSLAPEHRLVVTQDRAEIERRLDRIEIAAARFPHDLLLRAPRLRWYQQWGAGADWLRRYPDVRASGLILTNASGVHAIPISEHIIGMALALARGLHAAVRHQVEHRWHRPEGGIRELAGATMLLIGVGAIGSRTARLAKALDMRVLGVRRDPAQGDPHVDAMYGPGDLPELWAQADLVVLTVPLTDETHHMVDEAALRAMPSHAVIINIGRGGTIDQEALVRALQEGWIGGAGLDVFDPEPLSEDSPLWDMPNVLITSHYAGTSPVYNQRALAIFTDNLARYVAGQPLRNVVDKELGY